jgi:hypothetical protein
MAHENDLGIEPDATTAPVTTSRIPRPVIISLLTVALLTVVVVMAVPSGPSKTVDHTNGVIRCPDGKYTFVDDSTQYDSTGVPVVCSTNQSPTVSEPTYVTSTVLSPFQQWQSRSPFAADWQSLKESWQILEGKYRGYCFSCIYDYTSVVDNRSSRVLNDIRSTSPSPNAAFNDLVRNVLADIANFNTDIDLVNNGDSSALKYLDADYKSVQTGISQVDSYL